MKVTTKKQCKGEYKVYKNGVFVGNISAWCQDTYGKEWTCFDETNEWIGTYDTKKEALDNAYGDFFQEGFEERSQKVVSYNQQIYSE